MLVNVQPAPVFNRAPEIGHLPPSTLLQAQDTNNPPQPQLLPDVSPSIPPGDAAAPSPHKAPQDGAGTRVLQATMSLGSVKSDGSGGGALKRNLSEVESKRIDINDEPAGGRIEQPYYPFLSRPWQYFYFYPGKKKGHTRNVPLYQAALKGDWDTAKSIIDDDPTAASMSISDRKETALHIATRVKRTAFVKQLVEKMDAEALAKKNKYSNTALCIAAASGAVEIAKLMVNKHEGLPLVRGSGNATPVLIAATYKRKEMVSYLLSVTPVDGLNVEEQMDLLVGAISADYYDIALLILKWNKKLALERNSNGNTALHVMARKPTAIGDTNHLNIWQRSINHWFKGFYKNALMQTLGYQLVETLLETVLDDSLLPVDKLDEFIKTPTSLLHDAARAGNAEFLKVLIRSNPDLAWKRDDEQKTIFHVGVENRQEGVFSLIFETGEFLDYFPDYLDGRYISLLELAAKKAAPSHLKKVSGAAFQMQRELLWFKEVEKLPDLTMRRKYGNVALREVFTQEHKELVEEGEKWMKKTANSCMLVAALIATVVFAAAFAVPGGNNENTGTPIFLENNWFTVFVISNATALISSSTSILLFLSILTSHCVEDDFVRSLPLRLLFGLSTLFFSVLSMVLAFSATFFMLYGKATRVPLAIAGMAMLPVSCFCVLEYKIWSEAVLATYFSKFLFRHRKMKVF